MRDYKLVLSMMLETGELLPVWQERFQAQSDAEAIALAKDFAFLAALKLKRSEAAAMLGVTAREVANPKSRSGPARARRETWTARAQLDEGRRGG